MERVVAALLLALAAACAVRALVPSPSHEPEVRSAARASDPDPPDGTDLLRFTPDERDLGRIDGGASARVAFPWRRGGAGDLRVLALETDCGCAVASGLPDVVPEGASGTLVLDLRGRSRPGPFLHVVRLRVDRAPDVVLRLRVRGFVGSAVVVEPVALDVGRVATGLEVARVVTVRPPPGPDATHAEARIEAYAEAQLVGVSGTCEVRGPARPGVRGADVLVRARVPDRPGPFLGHVELRVAREGVWRIPLRGEAVVPEVPVSAGVAPTSDRHADGVRSARHSR
ncbi:MAG TPA: DUF1573 domain-containing protein [Planctomycetota bacterium]|nr:DUF1573 domain-containing protein [Planctomycetota bacterium]